MVVGAVTEVCLSGGERDTTTKHLNSMEFHVGYSNEVENQFNIEGGNIENQHIFIPHDKYVVVQDFAIYLHNQIMKLVPSVLKLWLSDSWVNLDEDDDYDKRLGSPLIDDDSLDVSNGADLSPKPNEVERQFLNDDKVLSLLEVESLKSRAHKRRSNYLFLDRKNKTHSITVGRATSACRTVVESVSNYQVKLRGTYTAAEAEYRFGFFPFIINIMYIFMFCFRFGELLVKVHKARSLSRNLIMIFGALPCIPPFFISAIVLLVLLIGMIIIICIYVFLLFLVGFIQCVDHFVKKPEEKETEANSVKEKVVEEEQDKDQRSLGKAEEESLNNSMKSGNEKKKKKKHKHAKSFWDSVKDLICCF
jgi:Na+-transporting methylmalonyl-CoA/oxaloacetate decarboxylase gamma subunit